MSRAEPPEGQPAPGVPWFLEESTLLAELKLARPAAAPPRVPGYSGLVEVARGGQGVVFAGVQDSTGQRVAVKVLHGGRLASEEERQRFRREVSLAASLRHPGIVRVYDSGELEGGLYLVMEFVEGEPIDRHAAGRPLAERLGLLAAVCGAVQHAHQRGVMHRDLKPTNIRVDAEGVPRVLDFGLAKAAGAEQTAVTGAGSFVGTLPWASPEQVSGDPSAVDTRSDVYALGVVLYQLVTGRMPYETGRERGIRAAVEAITTAVPAPLGPGLEGGGADLQAIVSRALAKDPAERYQSAGELEQDLRSSLEGHPIRARRDSLWRGMQRRMGRYRAAVAASVAVLVVVAGLLVLTLGALRRAREAGALAERRGAQQAAVNGFLARALAAADPSNLGRDARVIDFLDTSATAIDPGFGEDPATAAALHGTIGMTYRSLGAVEEARREVDRQVELARGIDGPDGPETLAAELNLALVLRSQSQAGEAYRLAHRVAEVRARTLGPGPATAEAFNIEGNVLADLDRLEEAEAVLRRAVDQRLSAEGEGEVEHPETVECMLTLAAVLRVRGKAADAEGLLARAVPGARRLLGPEHPVTLIAENNRANLLMNALGRPADAEPIFRAVAETQARKLGPGHMHTLGTRCNLATSLQRQGGQARIAEAEGLFRSCVDLSEKGAGPAAIRTLIYKNNLASLLVDLGRFAEARAVVEPAYTAARGALGEGHAVTVALERHLARSLVEVKDYPAAAAFLPAAFTRAAAGPDPDDARQLAGLMARLCEETGKPDLAAEWRARAEGK